MTNFFLTFEQVAEKVESALSELLTVLEQQQEQVELQMLLSTFIDLGAGERQGAAKQREFAAH